jgi:hypothetical protein
MSVDERVSLNGNRKAQVVKTLHKSVWQQIEKRNSVYTTKANKGRKHVVFQPGDWVSDLTLFTISDDSRSNHFQEREGMMRSNPTPSIIMPTIHWRC